MTIRKRSAFTLIELLVVMGVLSVIVALALPAVQQAREASRRASCLSNLRQLGLASHAYASTFGVMPPITLYDGSPGGRQSLSLIRHYSIFTRLLPDCDQRPLFDSLNFTVAFPDPYYMRGPWDFEGMAANSTAYGTTVAVFLCPDDGRSGDTPGRTNYRANHGTDRWWIPENSPFSAHLKPCSMASITDGLAQTVAFSEKLTGQRERGRFDPRVQAAIGGLGWPASADESLAECEARSTTEGFIPHVGLSWMTQGFIHTSYNHVIPPNSTLPDCFLARSEHYGFGFASPRSNHLGGVNIALCDGSARFLKNSIDRKLWRALGTRSGGEVVNPD